MEKWQTLHKVYEVSTLGRVRRKIGGPGAKAGTFFNIKPSGSGYIHTSLKIAGKSKAKLVHRLVAEAFIGPSLGREVNHIDGDKTNNKLTNLEYVIRSQNMQHAYDT